MSEGDPNLKAPHGSRSYIKSMLILFFDQCGIVHHKFFWPTEMPKESMGPDI